MLKVCEEFDKSKGVSNQNSINELLKQGWHVDYIHHHHQHHANCKRHIPGWILIGLPTYSQLIGWDANKILSESVVQLQRKDEDRWDLNIRPGETHMFENNPFRFDNQRQHHKTHFELQSSHPNTIVWIISKLRRDDVTEEEYRAANRAAKMKGRCDDEPRKPRARKVKDKTPLWSSESKVLYLVTTTSQGSGTPHTVYYTGSQGLALNSLNSQPTTHCRSIMNRKKVLLMGKSGSGKTSMR